MSYDFWDWSGRVKRKQREAKSNLASADVEPVAIPARLDFTIQTAAGHNYVVKSDHRASPTEHKSVWRISIPEEVACFDSAMAANWTRHAVSWGLHLAHQIALVLGENLIREVKIGKFVSNPPNSLWHAIQQTIGQSSKTGLLWRF
jgi:hypothetical protein